MKFSVYIATTLDGFIARKNGDLDWLPGSDGQVVEGQEAEDYGYHDFMDSVDVLIMGRNTYELVMTFGDWPYQHKKVMVLSKTLKELDNHLPTSVELRSSSPADLYEELKGIGAKHVYVDGGKTIQGFLHAGLIDELTITRVPVLIGSGIPLFGALTSDVPLQHVATKCYQNGFVQSKYCTIPKTIEI